MKRREGRKGIKGMGKGDGAGVVILGGIDAPAFHNDSNHHHHLIIIVVYYELSKRN